MLKLRPFQRRFWDHAFVRETDTAALSIPRGNGKSTLAGLMAAKAMRTIGPHSEIALCAASIEQARICFRVTRQILGETDFRYIDSSTRCGITRSDGARLRVIGSNGKTAMGLLRTPLVIADEPGAWEVVGGELMWDALTGAQGKPGSPLRIIVIGTLAPAGIPGHWWHDLVERGSHRSTYVQALQGDRERWDDWHEIRRVNPLANVDAPFRRKLLEERDEARRDSRLKARFLSYRLNIPTADEATVLLSVDDFRGACRRPEAGAFGRPIVGIDPGEGRAWSAAVAAWRSGRVEAVAVAPGVPDMAEQERRDRVPRGTYSRLMDAGYLRTAEGLRVPPVNMLMDLIRDRWGPPEVILSDTHRFRELQDHAGGVPLVMRRFRYEEATADIRATRKLFFDGPVVPAENSRDLLAASLAVARVRNHESGNVRLVKRDASNNTARDDVAAALVLACGALRRELDRPVRLAWRYRGMAG